MRKRKGKGEKDDLEIEEMREGERRGGKDGREERRKRNRRRRKKGR